MKIGTFMTDRGVAYGLVLGTRWLDIPGAVELMKEPPQPKKLVDFAASGDSAMAVGNRLQSMAVKHPEKFEGIWRNLDKTTFLPPFYPEGRLFTQRGNSCLFSRVVKGIQPEHPIWERRYSENMIGHNQKCTHLGAGCNPEFVAVIGKTGKDIPKEKVRDHIFGYTMMLDHAGLSKPVFYDEWGMEKFRDDLVFRDLMFVDSYYGNSLPSTPVGPWIVTKDEIPDPYSLMISAEECYEDIRLNEMVSSGASTFRFEDTYAFMSKMMTLKPGDMLSTSSIGYDGYQFWDDVPQGSWVQTTCEKIGSLRMYLN
ncbi:MAG: fumarylacetoacetate hydrolase family protein [Spirochaetia bacterium]|nr:fumarylacetoacetate hydrolase family protein [Spirochaetia bacterium]